MNIFKDYPVYYEVPMQVIFLRPGAQYEKGIVYHEDVIAARDGQLFSTKSVIRSARKRGVEADYAIIESFEWLPIDIK